MAQPLEAIFTCFHTHRWARNNPNSAPVMLCPKDLLPAFAELPKELEKSREEWVSDGQAAAGACCEQRLGMTIERWRRVIHVSPRAQIS